MSAELDKGALIRAEREPRDVSTVAVRALAPVALMGLIFYLSAQEAVGPELPAWTRVVAHAGEYALLAVLWVWALGPALGTRALALAAAISFLYAVSDEWHQSYVPGRDADPLDVAADAFGIALATILSRWRLRTATDLSEGRVPPA